MDLIRQGLASRGLVAVFHFKKIPLSLSLTPTWEAQMSGLLGVELRCRAFLALQTLGLDDNRKEMGLSKLDQSNRWIWKVRKKGVLKGSF